MIITRDTMLAKGNGTYKLFSSSGFIELHFESGYQVGYWPVDNDNGVYLLDGDVIGVWEDHVDLSLHLENFENAMSYARTFNQTHIWDWKNKQAIAVTHE